MAKPAVVTTRAIDAKTPIVLAKTPLAFALSTASAFTTLTALSAASWAQTAPSTPAATPPASSASSTDAKALKPVVVQEKAQAPEGKDALRATTSGIGKGQQPLRDIPQSVTVVTERLINDRNLDTVKEALHSTAGVTFLAAEGGEEDIRLRGFSLAATGDIFVDGMRDPAFYERDTFSLDRIELLRGSASMLFGRGSTGGAANQVSKLPRLINENQITSTVGNFNYGRLVGDFNLKTGENAALRISAMATEAANNGSGSSIRKSGVAPSFRWGIGTANEFLIGLYYLDNRNGMNYGLPWTRPSASAPVTASTINERIDPSRYYGAASDINAGSASWASFGHTHRFEGGSELKTIVRQGSYTRDQRASAIRYLTPTFLDTFSDTTVYRRGTNNKIQDMDTLYAQSDFSGKFSALGVSHSLLAGVDYAHEKFKAYNTTLPAGVVLTKPNTLAGTPDDGRGVNEGLRQLVLARGFTGKSLGLYAQNLVQVAPEWKVLLGLRHDTFDGQAFNAAGANPVTNPAVSRKRSDSLWSKRFGVLYQPTALASYHFSYGTSFNTSGDTYQYDNQTVNTPPEGSVNFELGAKLDSPDKRFTTRLAIFRAVKNHERNRDPDSAATQNLLSGKRHTAGFEVDLTGHITKQWDLYVSYAYTPVAKIDVGAPNSVPGIGEGAGTRSSLSPKHSGTVWSTYQLTPAFRFGGGINFRSSQTPNRNPGYAAASFATGDLMAEYTINDTFTIKANVSNVSNKLYADALYSGHYIPGAGRVFQIGLTTKF